MAGIISPSTQLPGIGPSSLPPRHLQDLHTTNRPTFGVAAAGAAAHTPALGCIVPRALELLGHRRGQHLQGGAGGR